MLKSWKHLLLAGSVSVAVCVCGAATIATAADSPDTLKQKAEHGDAKALQALRQAANRGDAAAEFDYALYLFSKSDVKESVAWVMKSARHGYPKAQGELGAYYVAGSNGVTKNPKKGIDWLKKAAAANDPSGEFNLGIVYYKGLGVTRDLSKAARWVKKAADQGYAQAQSVLGSLYEDGEGVPQDSAKAIEMYQKSANQGYEPAQFLLADVYAMGKITARDYMKAAYWFEKAAEHGSGEALEFLGELYYSGGPGLARDDSSAYKWLDIALGVLDKSSKLYGDASDMFDDVDFTLSDADRKAAHQAALDWWAQHKQAF